MLHEPVIISEVTTEPIRKQNILPTGEEIVCVADLEPLLARVVDDVRAACLALNREHESDIVKAAQYVEKLYNPGIAFRYMQLRQLLTDLEGWTR
jgi:hypothetical protein